MAPVLLAAWGAAQWVGFIAVLLFGIICVFFIAFKMFWKKASADLAFVKTGGRGASVIVDGGTFIIPALHEIKWVNLETMRLLVQRSGKDALITKDKFRVDVMVEFYIKVEPLKEQILSASRSLGEKSLTPDTVKSLVEAKLVGALRTVAATKDMIDLHQDRQSFEDIVQDNLRSDLRANGLTLESVAITHLDQTDKTALDPDNVFDAEGLKLITRATERARKEKNEIQRDAELAIKEKDVQTDIAIKAQNADNELKNNKIKQETEVTVKQQNIAAQKAKIDADQDLEQKAAQQFKEVETYKAERAAETQRFKYEQEQSVRTREIEKDRAIREADIQRELAVSTADLARQTAIVSKEREAEEARIAKELAVERAERDKQIGIIEKVREQEAAEAEKLATVAERERAAQHVITVQREAEAERDKLVVIIDQRAQSEREQIEKQIAADAEAYEIKKQAEAEAGAAEQRAQAIERLAEAKLKEAEAYAEGQFKLIEAKNATAQNILVQEAVLKLLEKAPEIVRETMAPADKISDIKILNLTGGGFGAGGNGGSGEGGSLVGKMVGSVLEAGAAYPLFKELLKFAKVDLDGKSPGELAESAVAAVRKLGHGEEAAAEG